MTALALTIAAAASLMAFLSRASGSDGKRGSLWTGWSGAPELAYGAVFGLACYSIYGNFWLSLVAFVVSWRAMELGHGTFYDMQGWKGADGPPHFGTPEKPRMQTLDYVLLPLFKRLKLNPRRPAYSWVAMGIKGLLIALPLGPFVALNAVLFPASYAITRHYWPSKPELAEWTAGACAGVLIAMLAGGR